MALPTVMAPITIRGRRKIRRSYTNYDAELDQTVCDRYTNADLTLTMRLGFRQVNPDSGNSGLYRDYNDNTTADGDPMGTQRRIVRWTPSSWQQWKAEFVRSAQAFWHGNFWLINNFSGVLEMEDGGEVYRQNIYCRFRLSGSDATAGSNHHHVIDVVRLHPSERWFGSHETLYDNLDTRNRPDPPRDSRGRRIFQRAHVHEIGHLLGMGHSGEGTPACNRASSTNDGMCYGTTDHERHNVMGQGMRIYPEHAYPWRRVAADITGRGTVRTPAANRARITAAQQASVVNGGAVDPGISSDWPSRMVRQYPRTLTQAQAGAEITQRPQRGQ